MPIVPRQNLSMRLVSAFCPRESEKTQQIRNESPDLLFLGMTNLAGPTAFFNRTNAEHDAANPRNPFLAT
jgi:hypothetical protein